MADQGLAALLGYAITETGKAIASAFSTLVGIFTNRQLTDYEKKVFMIVLSVLIALIIIGSVVGGILAQRESITSPVSVETSKAERERVLEGLEWEGRVPLEETLRKVPQNQQFLVNFAPLTARVGGYIGPKQYGVFDAEKYCRWALKAGIRCFVLPISFHEDDNKDATSKTTKQWPAALEPGIFFRDEQQQIISTNAITIRAFMEGLMGALNANDAQKNDPIMIYLVESPNRIPDKTLQEDIYARFLNKMAVQLASVGGLRDKMVFSLGSYGSAIKAQAEEAIYMKLPITNFAGKIFFGTNFDITIAEKSEYSQKYRDTLGNYIHFRLRPRTGKDNKGFTRTMRVEDVSGSKEDWPNEARTFFLTSALERVYEDSVYDVEIVRGALEKGIQCIPLPFVYSDLTEPLKGCHGLWNGTAWRVKPDAFRFTQPTPVTAATPSDRLNARVEPNLQPGQTSIK
jgi:hypothetical protein